MQPFSKGDSEGLDEGICGCKVGYRAVNDVFTEQHSCKLSFINSRIGIKALLVLIPLFGLTWIFGLFAVGSATKSMQILFSIFNGLQVSI